MSDRRILLEVLAWTLAGLVVLLACAWANGDLS